MRDNTVKTRTTACTFCKKRYIEPCHGKKASCQNKLFLEGKLKPVTKSGKAKR